MTSLRLRLFAVIFAGLCVLAAKQGARVGAEEAAVLDDAPTAAKPAERGERAKAPAPGKRSTSGVPDEAMEGWTESPNPYGLMGFSYSHAAEVPNVDRLSADFMELYKLTGARWDRRDFWWTVCEPEKGRWEWDYFDHAVEEFRQNSVNAVIILCYGSKWNDSQGPSTDEEIEEYGEYVFQMVSRYKHWIKHWEIWNEPNILPFWAPKPNAENYTKMLQTAYRRAKEADPDCVVIGGAMAGADLRFLRNMYKHGAKGSFDALSYHTYSNNPVEEGQRKEIETMRAIMEENDDLKPLWLTETGIYTGPAGVSEKIQAERIVKSSIRWVSMGIVRIFQLSLKDWQSDANVNDATSFRGLANSAGEAKPSLYAHRTLSDTIGDLEYVGRPRLHPKLDAYVFSDGDRSVLVAWGEENESTTVSLKLDARTLLKVDIVGQKEVIKANSRGAFDLVVDQSPIYLENVGEAILLAAGASLEPMSGAASRGSFAALEFKLANPLDRDVKIRPIMASSRGVIVGQVKPLTLLAGKKAKCVVQASIASGASLGENLLSYFLQIDGRIAIPLFSSLDVENPYHIAFAPFDRLDLDAPALELEVVSRSTKDCPDAQLNLKASEGLMAQSATLELTAGESQSIPVALDLENMESGEDHAIEASLTCGDLQTTAAATLRLLKVFRLPTAPVIDGDLSDWAAYEKNIKAEMMTEVDFNPNLQGGAADISASGWAAWDDEALYVALEIGDDVIQLPEDHIVWDYDSLQLAFDIGNDAVEKSTFDKNDFEFEVAALRDGSTLIDPGHYPDGFIDSVVAEQCDVAVSVDRDAGKIRYEIRIPAAVAPPLEMTPGRVFGFNFIQNDNDGEHRSDREGWLELAPGIGWGKHPAEYYDAILWP